MEEEKELNQEIFDRQIRIKDWDQEKLENQKVLILGMGGLGTVVLIQLLRLGVKEIHFLDFDTIDLSNLPRQFLFGKEDVGKKKVDVALKNAQIHNISNSQLYGYHMDAVKEFQKVIELAKKCDFVFNLIDHGDYWDLAVCSLCLSLKIPHISGGNFASSMMLDFYMRTGEPCYLCLTPDLKEKEIVEKFHPDLIQNYRDISFIPANDNPISQSSATLCTSCGVFLANMFKCAVMTPEKDQKSRRVMIYLDNIETLDFGVVAEPKCKYCNKNPIAIKFTDSGIIQKESEQVWEDIKRMNFKNVDEIFFQQIEKQEVERQEGEKIKKQTIYQIKLLDNTMHELEIKQVNDKEQIIEFDWKILLKQQDLDQLEDNEKIIEINKPEQKEELQDKMEELSENNKLQEYKKNEIILIKNKIQIKNISLQKWTFMEWEWEFPDEKEIKHIEKFRKIIKQVFQI